MIRVLLIPSSDYLGHPFPQRHNHLFERLNDFGDFEVHVLRLGMFGQQRLNTRCIVHEMSKELRVRSSAAGYYLLNFPLFITEIRKIINREAIDVVVMGNLAPPFAYVLLKSLLRDEVPVVFDLQDHYPTSATGYLADVSSLTGNLLVASFQAMLRFIIIHSNVVTVPGVALAEYAKMLGAKEVVAVPNGISEHFLNLHDGSEVRERLNLKDGDFVVGYVGSMEFWLDMKTVLRAVAEAVRDGISIKLMLVGGRLQTDYMKRVREWVNDYGLEKSVLWCGFIAYEEVPKYMAEMDVGLIPFNVKHPTAWHASPNKMWEYLSQGKPVISTPIPEAVANKDLLYLAKNEEDYVRIFRELFDGSLEFSWKVEEGRKIASRKTWNNSAKKMAETLTSLVNGPCLA